MAVIRFDHAGLVVRDLETAVRFFVDLGFQREGAAEVGGPWVDRVIGLTGVRAEMVMVSAPDGSGKLELSTFHHPARDDEPAPLPADAYGYRHLAYQVTDVDEVVARAREAGYETAGEIVEYEDVYRLAYIRGPEGLLLEVAQPLGA